MKTIYSTITLRYVHDVVTGEFVNIGVVLYAPEQRFLDARFTTSYERLNAAFLKIDHLHFRALMRYMANRFEELGGEVRDGLMPPAGLSELVKQVLPPDDSSLQWSQQGGGITDDPARVLTELYKRMVERFIAGEPAMNGNGNGNGSRNGNGKVHLDAAELAKFGTHAH